MIWESTLSTLPRILAGCSATPVLYSPEHDFDAVAPLVSASVVTDEFGPRAACRCARGRLKRRGIAARQSQVMSSSTFRMRTRRPPANWSCTKSSDQRALRGAVSGSILQLCLHVEQAAIASACRSHLPTLEAAGRQTRSSREHSPPSLDRALLNTMLARPFEGRMPMICFCVNLARFMPSVLLGAGL